MVSKREKRDNEIFLKILTQTYIPVRPYLKDFHCNYPKDFFNSLSVLTYKRRESLFLINTNLKYCPNVKKR